MRVLVVDDDFVGRSKIKSILAKHSHCTPVSGGKLAIEAFKKAHLTSRSYDLITMDVDMPDMRGQDVVKEIRMWERQNLDEPETMGVKIMMITAMSDENSARSSFQAGCDSFLRKPVTPDKLEVALKELGLGPENAASSD